MSTETSIDIQVAREVMGWHQEELTIGDMYGEFLKERFWLGSGKAEEDPQPARLWHPTRSWGSIGMVLDRMAELGWTYNLHHSDFHGKVAVANFFKRLEKGGEARESVSDPSPPRAICLAALAAVRKETTAGTENK